jgi:hypothetical protein
MTRSCCPTCRLRFSRATAVHLTACPFCAQPLQDQPVTALLGFKLIANDALLADEPAVDQAISVALPLPPRADDDASTWGPRPR